MALSLSFQTQSQGHHLTDKKRVRTFDRYQAPWTWPLSSSPHLF